jgi:hypothetical protein
MMKNFTSGISSLINKTALCCTMIVFLWHPLVAQDKIYKTDNTIIEAKVAEVNDTEIKYTKFSNPNGPKYVISKANVLMIVYENGEKEVYKTNESKQIEQPAKFVMKDSLQFLEELWGVKFENTDEKGGGVKVVALGLNSIFKPQTPLKKLVVINVKNGDEPVRVKNTSELTRVLFESYNQGVSKINLYTGKGRISQLAYYANDQKGIDIAGLSKFQGENANIKKLGINESRNAGNTVAKVYSPSQNWVMQGFCSGLLFGLPGIALVDLVALLPPITPAAPPNVDANAWLKGYKSKIKRKRFITGMIGGTIGAVLMIGAFSSVN